MGLKDSGQNDTNKNPNNKIEHEPKNKTEQQQKP